VGLGVVLVFPVLLAGCGGKPRAVSTAGKPQSSAVKPIPASALNPDLVNAVSTANSTTPISLKFRIEQKPLVGQPVGIELTLIPAQGVDIDHIHASFQVSDGMQLASERAFDVEQPEAGVPLEHELTVLPQQPGVLQITATVVVDSDSGSIARIYAIPVIADGPPAA
jgi:hypothetical protein